jgi:hypothetical protein
MTSTDKTQRLIAQECERLKTLLLLKNKNYGNSALEPQRIFSSASPVEQILVRIDDKLSRIKSTGFDNADEDTTLDLAGYLILLHIAKLDESVITESVTYVDGELRKSAIQGR